MADTDTIDVTFAKQKVYHDGTSMVVAKAGDTKPVERRMVPGLLADGSIKEPKGWAEEIAEKNSYAVADGGPQFSPAPDADAPPAGDGEEGDDAFEPVSLAGKNKAELTQIAADEEVTFGEGATNAEIVTAIESKRAEDENAPA